MDNFNITDIPVFNRLGKRVGTDKIRRYIDPPTEVPILEGNVRAVCTCGKTHDIPEADFKSWPTATLEKCACSRLKV